MNNRIANSICFVLISLLICFHLAVLTDLIFNYNEYRFGTEVSGYRYYSIFHYVGLSVLFLLIGLIGLCISKLRINATSMLIIRLIIIFLMLSDLIAPALIGIT